MDIKEALLEMNVTILKYRTYKPRGLETDRFGKISVEKFSKLMISELSKDIEKYYPLIGLAQHLGNLTKALQEYTDSSGTLETEPPVDKNVPQVPEEYKNLVLNLDMAYSGNSLRFFMTDERDIISKISGGAYIKVVGMKEEDAVLCSRKVIPEYLPRNKKGVDKRVNIYGQEETILNTYIPPKWMEYAEKNRLKDSLPESFDRLVNHLFPLKIEREFLFSWIYHSLFSRSFVYLVLCGAPGTGKNRLKLILRALHGHENTIDGKKSTLVERFNSQLADATLAWFDELSYGIEMENVMKELQNDSISIERKGIDASRSTRIYSSLVVSNNKPRDNFISFDSRKFVPLCINSNRLEKSMDPGMIARMSSWVEDPTSPTYNLPYIARIGNWIKNHGFSDKWPHLEYRGPMFFMLAHTSMTRWQKRAVTIMADAQKSIPGRAIVDAKKGILWSSLQDLSPAKATDRSSQFPDFTTIKYFFDIFLDSKGNKAFSTTSIKDNIMGDFWIKPVIDSLKIVTEAELMGETNDRANKARSRSSTESIDL